MFINKGLRRSVTGLAAVLAFAVPVAAQDKTVVLGVLGAFAGPFAADAVEGYNGAALAAKEINAAGGIDGFMFEVEKFDTKEMTPDAVLSAVERLKATDNLGAIVTPFGSLSGFEMDYVAEIGVPYMVAANSNQYRSIITEDPEFYKNTWSLAPSYDAYQTELPKVVNQMIESGSFAPENKTYAIIGSDNPYSMPIYEGLKKAMDADGWEMTFDDVVPPVEINDWRVMLSKIRENPPAVIINTEASSSNAAAFMNQFMEDPTDSLLFIQYAPSVPEFVDLTKENSTGVLYNMLGGPISAKVSDRTKEIGEKYAAEYGYDSSIYGYICYEMVYLYADLLKEVGDPSDYDAINATLAETDKEMVHGRVKFDPETHLSIQGDGYLPIQFYQIWEGDRVTIYPPVYATGDSRTPPWMAN
ncbi:ABC transporter substrate-binding protein [Chachezhania antarctica]|uniref:ABC transporter substrate-binding protein n=1 Tax=Chachezhania antarctica TaxID=2340860 RepID=UPI0013CEB6A3|nr:ABC transporter substrate-binding protein [Chachezhania antarctica]|tara:strand:+ start:3801 stop:5045 length:1245 start_codon:yes stop_codon:yes gene_type:complete